MVKEYYAITDRMGNASYFVYKPKEGLRSLSNINVRNNNLVMVHKIKSLDDLKEFDRNKKEIIEMSFGGPHT